jgi:hypothetical protein
VTEGARNFLLAETNSLPDFDLEMVEPNWPLSNAYRNSATFLGQTAILARKKKLARVSLL